MNAMVSLRSVLILTLLGGAALGCSDSAKSGGETGSPGGADGTDGTDGSDGSDGADGSDGSDGTDGSDGSDGTDGTDGGDGIDPRFAEVAAAVEADLEAALATGAQVAVWMDGEVHYVGGFGSASPTEDQPVTEDTRFMIGSDTKKLAAISLLTLVEDGVVSLDDTVGTLLPALDPVHATPFLGATVHELLSHQGGSSEWYEFTHETTDARLAEVAYGPFAEEAWSMAPPGRLWNYSNPNFSIAGLIDETHSGAPWADLVEGRIFAPLGMDHSHARKSTVTGPVSGGTGVLDPEGGRIGAIPFDDTWESGFARPAGMVWSTASDQARLAAALVDGMPGVLDPALLDAVHSPQVDIYPDLPGAYGYGLMVDPGFSLGRSYYETPLWSHGGNTLSHTSTFYVLPAQRFAVVILSNGYGDDFTGTVVAAFTSLAALPAPGTAPEAPVVDLAAAADFVGQYEDPYNVGLIDVSIDEAGLRVSMPDLDDAGIRYDAALSPITTHLWIANIQGSAYDLTFVPAADDDRGPEAEVWIRNRAFVAHRPGGGATTSLVPAGEGTRPTPAVLRARLRAAAADPARAPRLHSQLPAPR